MNYPTLEDTQTMQVGQTAHGKIVCVRSYGAMVQLENGVTGLVHISEVADGFIKDIHQHCSVGASVVVYILRHGDDGRWEFSLRRAQTGEAGKMPDEIKAEQPTQNAVQRAAKREAFDEKMRDFLSDSSERQEDARRDGNERRGGKGKRR